MPINYIEAQKNFEKYDSGAGFTQDSIFWCGSVENCDVCSRPLESELYMIDGPAGRSPSSKWGNLCIICVYKYCPVIECGKAQLYRKEKDGEWLLIAGGMQKSDSEYDF